MQGLIKKARSSLTRGPFHKPALQIQGADQRLRYACASRSVRHQPEVFYRILSGFADRILGYYYWEPVFAHWFGTGPFPPEEKSLEIQNLYPLQGLLNYWRQSNATAIASIPKERLLVLETKKLSESLGQLENFLELESGSLDTKKSHLHRSSIAEDPLKEVPDGYIKELSSQAEKEYRDMVKGLLISDF